MTKKLQSFSSNDVKEFRSFIKKQIELKYDQFFHWKTFVGLIPLFGSIINLFSTNPNTISLKSFLKYNFESFGKTNKSEPIYRKYKFYSPKLFILPPANDQIIENQTSSFLNNYQVSQLWNSIEFNSNNVNKTETLPLLLESKNAQDYSSAINVIPSKNGINSILSSNNKNPKILQKFRDLKTLTKVRQFKIAQNFKTDLLNPNETLIKKLKISKLNNLDSTRLYYFLKQPIIYQNYSIAKNSNQNINLRSMSGNYYINNMQTLLKNNEPTASNVINKPFPIPFDLEKNYTYTVKENNISNSKITVEPGNFMKFSLKLDPKNNDIIFENPYLLSKIVSSLQYQTEYDDTSFDFFGGIIKKRPKFQTALGPLNNESKIYINDLKKEYFSNKSIEKDKGILETNIIPEETKYPTNVREIKNHFGDHLISILPSKTNYLQTKALVEISLNNQKSQSPSQFNQSNTLFQKKNLLVTVDIPPSWELENKVLDSTLPKKKSNTNTVVKTTLYNKKTQLDLFEKRKFEQYQYFPTIFSLNNKTSFLVNTHQYLTNSYWLALTQLSLCFFLINLLADLNKTYQKELAYYLLEFMSQANFYDEDIKSIIEQVYNDGSIRVFEPGKTSILEKTKPSFVELAGMMELIPKFGQIVWHLKNKCRPTKQSNFIPQAVLLVGPPGTGKTLLVKTIGAEAGVPVLILSGNGVVEDNDGITKLQDAFKKARSMSPCILFIDEMDSIAAKRNELELTNSQLASDKVNDIQFRFDSKMVKPKNENASKKISALTQLLVEMDGIEKRRGFVVFGATNRRENLDPALTRPGRFNDIIEIGLPDKTKRIEILKLSTRKLGIAENISWDFFAKKTVGFSAADLTTMANRSAIHSILIEQKHTKLSLLRGLTETKTSSSSEMLLKEDLKKFNSPEIIIPLAYYEFGRYLFKTNLLNIQKNNNFLLDFLLNEDYSSIDFSDASQNQNINLDFLRSFKISDREKITDTISEKIQTFRPKTIDLLLLILVQLAGKASESMFLVSNSKHKKLHQFTNLGEIDLLKANLIAEYYKKLLMILDTESFESTTKLNEIALQNRISTKSQFSILPEQLKDFPNKQIWNSKSLWLNILGETVQNPNWRQWFRIHLPNPEPTIFNEEIVFTDIFQNKTKHFKYYPIINDQFGWDDVLKLSIDIDTQNVLFLCYIQILYYMDLHRQDLDRLVFMNFKETISSKELIEN